jgi:hypothetical protein
VPGTFFVRQNGSSDLSIQVNGEQFVESTFEDFDGETVGGATVTATRGRNQTDGTITITGDLASWGFGGTTGERGQTLLQGVVVQTASADGVPIVVDPSSTDLVVSTSWQGEVPGVDTRLVRPDGSEVDPAAARSTAATATNQVWRIKDPEPGSWRLRVRNLDREYVVTASAVTDIALDLLLDPTTELAASAVTGAEMPIVAVFAGTDGPLPGADVTATVTDPLGRVQLLNLLDDGDHGDGGADDGIYGASYTATAFGDQVAPDAADGAESSVVGSYRVRAVGVAGDDVRQDRASFALTPDADDDGDGLPDAWEIRHGLDPANPDDARSDGDGDKLDARCELEAGTDPRSADTDGGGESDTTEVVERDGLCAPGERDPRAPDDDRVRPVRAVLAHPEAVDGVPQILVRWGNPSTGTLLRVDLFRRPVDPATGAPAAPFVRIAQNLTGHEHTDTTVLDGDVVQYRVVPTVRDERGDEVPGGPVTGAPTEASSDPYPPQGAIVIDGGATTTRDRIVELELTVDDTSPVDHADSGGVAGSTADAMEMRVANGTTTDPAQPFVPYRRTMPDWDLGDVAPGDTATVVVEFRDEAGNVSSGGFAQIDSIKVVGADGAIDPTRLAGPNRVETATTIARDQFADDSAGAVLLARADNYPDALAGTPLAARRNAPLLLTDTAALSAPTAAELVRVLPPGGEVLILGGPGAVSQAVEDAVRALGLPTRRLAGPTRIETAVAVARELGDPATLLLATGFNFPDALAAGAAAAAADAAVLLVNSDARAQAVDDYVASYADAPQLVAIGGPAARPYPEAERVAGSGRDATAVLVAQRFFDRPVTVGLARNDVFADALTGGPHVARRGGPIVLSARTRWDPTRAVTCARCAERRPPRTPTGARRHWTTPSWPQPASGWAETAADAAGRGALAVPRPVYSTCRRSLTGRRHLL